jgi:hypothetical protein
LCVTETESMATVYPSSHSPESGGHLHVFDSYRASLVGFLCLCSNKLLNSEVPAWLAKNPASGGAVFSRRTPGNQPYPPPADPPRQALPSLNWPGAPSFLFKAPLFSRANPRSPDREFGTNDGEDRGITGRFVTAVVWLVYNSRHDPTALKPLRENRPQHATVIHL